MTNTKFRKRALLSSVAMLLVALVALGSATFAWFVDDPTADAKGLTASSQSSTGLQVKTDSTPTFSHHAKIAYKNATTAATNIALAPAMLDVKDNTFHSVKAESAAAPAAKTGEKWSAVATVTHAGEATGVYHETITLRKTGTSDVADELYVSGLDLKTAGNMANAVVVVLKDASNNYYVFTPGSSRSVPKWNSTNAIENGTTVYAATTESFTSKAAGKYDTKSAAQKIGDFAANSANQEIAFDMYVYLDGQHDTVYSDNAISAASIIEKCNFYFALGSDYKVTADTFG